MPEPFITSTYSPAGVAAMLQRAGMPPGIVLAVPKIDGFSPRGIAVLLSIFHHEPSDMMNCGPRMPTAIDTGLAMASAALNGKAGNGTRAVWAPFARSTTLTDSPPVFAT